MRATAPLLAALFVSGCFTYLPIEPGEAEPGLAVRARVNSAAGARIAPLLGATDARELDGTVITRSADTLIVEVPTVMADTREFGRTPNQRLSIARSDLVELEVRKLDRTRTSLVAGAAAILAASVLVKALRGEPGKEPLPGGGGNDAIVLRVIWGRQ